MNFFFNDENKVHRVTMPGSALPAAIVLRGASGAIDSTGFVVITQLTYQQNTNHQINHALDDAIYLLNFGDMVGEITVGGVAFGVTCEGNIEGIPGLLQFYEQNKISKATATKIPSVQITIGKKSFVGYLTGLQITVADPVMRTASFQMSLKVIP